MPTTQLYLVASKSAPVAIEYLKNLLDISRDQIKTSRNQKLATFVSKNSISLDHLILIVDKITNDFIKNEIDYTALDKELEAYVVSQDKSQANEKLISFLNTQGIGLVRQNFFYSLLTHVLPSLEAEKNETDKDKVKLEISSRKIIHKFSRKIIHNMFKDLLGTLKLGHFLYQAKDFDAYSSFILYIKLLEQFETCDIYTETYIDFLFNERITIPGGLQNIAHDLNQVLTVFKLKHQFYLEHQLPDKTEETLSLCRLIHEKINKLMSENENDEINNRLSAVNNILIDFIDQLQNKRNVPIPSAWQIALKDWSHFYDSVWMTTKAPLKTKGEKINYKDLIDNCAALQAEVTNMSDDENEQLAILSQLRIFLINYTNMPIELRNSQLLLAIDTLLDHILMQSETKRFKSSECSSLSICGIIQTIHNKIRNDLSQSLITDLQPLINDIDNTLHNKELHRVFKELKEIVETENIEDKKIKTQNWVAKTDIKQLFLLIEKYLISKEDDIFLEYAKRLSIANEHFTLIKQLPIMAHLVPMSEQFFVQTVKQTIEFYAYRRDICQVWDFLLTEIATKEHFQNDDELLIKFKEMLTIALCEDMQRYGKNAIDAFLEIPIVDISAFDLYHLLYDLMTLLVKNGDNYIAEIVKKDLSNASSIVRSSISAHYDLLKAFSYISSYYSVESFSEVLQAQAAALIKAVNENSKALMQAEATERKPNDVQFVEKMTALNKITNLFNILSFIINLQKSSQRIGPRSLLERSFSEQCDFVKKVYSNLTKEELLEKKHFNAATMLADLFRNLCYASTTEFQSDAKNLYGLILHINSIFNKIENKAGPILALQQIYFNISKDLLYKMKQSMSQNVLVQEQADRMSRLTIIDKERIEEVKQDVEQESNTTETHEQEQTMHDVKVSALEKQYDEELKKEQQELVDKFSTFNITEDEKTQKAAAALGQAHQANLKTLHEEYQRKTKNVRQQHQRQLDKLKSSYAKQLNNLKSSLASKQDSLLKVIKKEHHETVTAETEQHNQAIAAIKLEFDEKIEKAKSEQAHDLATRLQELDQQFANFKSECEKKYEIEIASLQSKKDETIKQRELELAEEKRLLEEKLQKEIKESSTNIQTSLQREIHDLESKSRSTIDEIKNQVKNINSPNKFDLLPQPIGRMTYPNHHAFILMQLKKANIPFYIVGSYPLHSQLGLKISGPMTVMVNATCDSLPVEFVSYGTKCASPGQLKIGELLLECAPWEVLPDRLRTRQFNIETLICDFDGNVYDVLEVLPEIKRRTLVIQQLSHIQIDPTILFKTLENMGKYQLGILEAQRSMLLLNQYQIATLPFKLYLSTLNNYFICDHYLHNFNHAVNFGALSGIIPTITDDFRNVLNYYHPYLAQFWCDELASMNSYPINVKPHAIIALFLLLPVLETMRITGSSAIDSVDVTIQKYLQQFTSGLTHDNKASFFKSLRAILISSEPTLEQQLPPEQHCLMTRYNAFLQQAIISRATNDVPKTYLTGYPALTKASPQNTREVTRQRRHKKR